LRRDCVGLQGASTVAYWWYVGVDATQKTGARTSNLVQFIKFPFLRQDKRIPSEIIHERQPMNKAFVRLQCELPTMQSLLWGMLCGIVGTLLLTGFLSSILSLELLTVLFPAIAGFNAAISGFMVIERTVHQIKRKKRVAFAAGIAVALFSVIAINLLSFQLFGFLLVSDTLAVITIIIGAIFGWCGGILSIKQKALKESG
jgi:hypothetical protein